METSTAIYFFGDRGMYNFLSNFHNAPFTDPESKRTFSSSEYFYIYHKCLKFDPSNTDMLDKIATSEKPPKKLGRQIANFDESEWESFRYGVMKRALLLKFSQNRQLRDCLLRTGNKELFEAAALDKIWGIGFGPAEAVTVPREEYGLNLLGRCLMEVRDELRAAVQQD